MKDKCQDQRDENRTKADGGPGKSQTDGQKYRDKLKADADAAKENAEKNPDDPGLRTA